MSLKIYKIRKKGTELFSTGGINPDFVEEKKGKIWKQIGHVKSHLTQFKNSGYAQSHYPEYPDQVEIIEYNFEEMSQTVVE